MPAYTYGAFDGTTSACAENTMPIQPNPNHYGNYLRVRGEYMCITVCGAAMWELPPRARRIPPTGVGRGIDRGTTSACAENTDFFPFSPAKKGNYLRVRGEYPPFDLLIWVARELPPRARRIHFTHPSGV